jgi:hypothetical protein
MARTWALFAGVGLLALLFSMTWSGLAASPHDGAPSQEARDSTYDLTWRESTRPSASPSAWYARNRINAFRTYFTEQGIHVISRVAGNADWELFLSLIGYGRGVEARSVPAARLSPSGNRILYARDEITEWYLNDKRGLEQGFELTAPPERMRTERLGGERRAPGGALDDAVFIELALGGRLSPSIDAEGQAVDLLAPGGRPVLRYSQLRAYDATGRALPARMEVFGQAGVRGIRLVVEDRDAVYPLTIDPLLTTSSWDTEGDLAQAWFGASVSTAGDVNGDGFADVLVGARQYKNGETNEGRAFVFHGSSAGPSLSPDWMAEGDQENAQFGWSLTTAGDVNGDGYADVIIGARLYANNEPNEGRAFVYHGSASGLSLTPDWTAEIDLDGAQFGRAVAPAGDVNGDGFADVLVGAPFYDNEDPDEGGVFVYHGSASGLSPTADLVIEGNQESAQFGFTLMTAGDVNGDGYSDVIVGARLYDNGETDEGRAFVFHGSASGLSTTPAWTAESDQDSYRLGNAVSTAGDVDGDGYSDVIIGVRFFENGETREGAAVVVHGSPSGLSPGPSWIADGDQNDADLGFAVGTAGDVNADGYADVIVGSEKYTAGVNQEGRAWVYHGSPSGLSTTADWTTDGNEDTAWLGYAVFTAGDVNGDGSADVIVGAPLMDNPEVNEGRAFVYHGSPTGLSSSAGWTVEGNLGSAEFGRSAGTAGDVNGDGYGDTIQVGQGLAQVYHGSEGGPASIADWTSSTLTFVQTATAAGDVNSDGYTDVVVADAAWGTAEEGKIWVFHGSAMGLSTSSAWEAEGDAPGNRFGSSARAAGDVNGDGFGDLIVGAPGDELDTLSNEGVTYVFHGSATGLDLGGVRSTGTPPNADWTAAGGQADAEFGAAAGGAGDVDGDGYSDVIVGAPLYSNSAPNEGRAFVYRGSAAGLAPSPSWFADGGQADADLGRVVGAAGDVNGDGFTDVIVGAPLFDGGQGDTGRVGVHHGSATGPSATADWSVEGTAMDEQLGVAAAAAGDVNGDGLADVVVGTMANEAILYHGSTAGLPLASDWKVTVSQGCFGCDLGTAGDVNGDGYADLIVGHRGYSNGETDEGRAVLYFGNGGKGLSLRPQQRRVDDAGLISPTAASDARDGIRLQLRGRGPFGRGQVKLEWELEPLGTPFDGIGTQTSVAWMDSGTAGTSLNELISGLALFTNYHWRVRLLYHQAATPFQQQSRWLTIPWNGWQEADLRTPRETLLTVTQFDSADPVLVGENVVYTVQLMNNGPDPGEVVLRDELPVASFLSAVPDQGSCSTETSMLTCELGVVGSGATVDVVIEVESSSASVPTLTNTAWVSSSNGRDADSSDNFGSEATAALEPAVGDRVWQDDNGNGVQDGAEGGVAGVLVALYDDTGSPVATTFTDADGNYSIGGLTLGGDYFAEFIPPAGLTLTSLDQGDDDAMDSDADPVTRET